MLLEKSLILNVLFSHIFKYFSHVDPQALKVSSYSCCILLYLPLFIFFVPFVVMFGFYSLPLCRHLQFYAPVNFFVLLFSCFALFCLSITPVYFITTTFAFYSLTHFIRLVDSLLAFLYILTAIGLLSLVLLQQEMILLLPYLSTSILSQYYELQWGLKYISIVK